MKESQTGQEGRQAGALSPWLPAGQRAEQKLMVFARPPCARPEGLGLGGRWGCPPSVNMRGGRGGMWLTGMDRPQVPGRALGRRWPRWVSLHPHDRSAREGSRNLQSEGQYIPSGHTVRSRVGLGTRPLAASLGRPVLYNDEVPSCLRVPSLRNALEGSGVPRGQESRPGPGQAGTLVWVRDGPWGLPK